MTEHFDVLIVGAGISGIDAAYHLQTRGAHRSFAILEGRGDIGGTWDLFRYPGVRSDSDMHTLGFSFKPWVHEKAIADGPSIMAYLRETVSEFGIDRHIRFHHLVRRAEWDSATARWTLIVERADTGESLTLTCGFLFMCSGYYSYRHGHRPDFPGEARFGGVVVHPQEWPEDLDHAGRRVAVIGSGATAVTIVPAMAETAAHVTMVQRTPTWMVARPDKDPIANTLRRLLPDAVAYRITRRKNIRLQQFGYRMTRTKPEKVRAKLLAMLAEQLPSGYPIERDFTPTYNPWDQRLCLVPNGDLFRAISAGRVSVVTGAIDTWTETGIRMTSGEEIPADIIVTATGLELVTIGDMEVVVDGAPVDFGQTWTYKGVAYSDVPNLASVFGYVNASWTLRADLVCSWVCRLLDEMERTGAVQATPRLRAADHDMAPRPWIADFPAGYIRRALPLLPKQGDRAPWLNPQTYAGDVALLEDAPIADGVMQLTGQNAASYKPMRWASSSR
jgi:cation diffusion facilitator CzcD-associated flavoprotein CzcO